MKPTDKDYPITPDMIDASKHLFDAFNHLETETSAGWIVRFCQRRGSWAPFTYAEIDGYYRERGQNNGFTFNRLLAKNLEAHDFVSFHLSSVDMGTVPAIRQLDGEPKTGFVVVVDETFVVTHEFVTRCFGSSPTKKNKKARAS